MYALDEDKQGIAVVKPIETRYCMDRIEFDLMDFRAWLTVSLYTFSKSKTPFCGMFGSMHLKIS